MQPESCTATFNLIFCDDPHLIYCAPHIHPTPIDDLFTMNVPLSNEDAIISAALYCPKPIRF